MITYKLHNVSDESRYGQPILRVLVIGADARTHYLERIRDSASLHVDFRSRDKQAVREAVTNDLVRRGLKMPFQWAEVLKQCTR